MFAVALVIRLAVAPKYGFYGDVRYFRSWSQTLHVVGIRHFYDSVGDTTFVYPPGYLYVLAILGRISSFPSYLLVKLPAMLADLALAWVAGVFAVRIAPPEMQRRIPVRAAVVAAVLFNPAVFVLSAIWGQVDAVPAVFALASLLFLLTRRQTVRREIAAIVMFGIAFAMKPQSSFLFPVLAYALYRHHLHGRSIRDVGAIGRGLGRIVAVSLPGVLLLAFSGLPFGLSPTGLKDFYSKASAGYKITSVWAFNVWGVVGFQRADVRSAPTPVQLVAGIPAFDIGLVLFVAGTAYVLWRAHRSINRGHSEALVLVASAGMTTLLAFTLLTRMHERYVFPVLACLAPLVLWRGFRRVYAAVSVLFVLNMWYPFAVYNRYWPAHPSTFEFQPLYGWIFGPIDATDTFQKKLWSLLMVIACFALVALGFRWIERLRRDDPDADAASEPSMLSRLRMSRFVVEAETEASVSSNAVEPEPDTTSRWLRLLPLSLVIAACVFSLVVLRSETTPVNNLNDSAFHMEMVRWADHQIAQGKVPLDGWFANLGLGSSFFHHYQSLPYTITAYAARITGLGDQTTYLWFQYLLLALWPISVYLGARLLNLERWPAAAAALLSPLIVSVTGYGFEHESYTWQGLGVYTQLFGMWLLPMAWGLTWRAVSKGRNWYAPAALVLALTMATHLMTGYLAVLSIGVWALLRWRGIVLRIGRAAVVAVGALATAAWVMVPLFADRNYSAQTQFYKGTIFNDSYGAGKIVRWLRTGELFDHGRFPVFTLLVAVGFVMCVIRSRRSEPARAVLGVWTLSLLLFFGRTTFGSAVKVLPASGDLQMHRFMEGVDLASILLAGIGLVAVAQLAAFGVRRALGLISGALAKPAIAWGVIAVAVVALLAPAWSQVGHNDLHDGTLITYQRAFESLDGADFKALVLEAEQRGGGRIYAGLRANWGEQYRIGSVPAYAELENYDADAIGYPFRTIQSLSTDVDASFEESIPAQYEILNIKYMILPSYYGPPPVPATQLDKRGRHTLYEVATTGYFQVVDITGSLTADRTSIARSTNDFRYSNAATLGHYLSVAFNGQAGIAATVGPPAPKTPAGSVIDTSIDAPNGAFTATVQADRTSVVLLKESFDPRWSVTVDGQATKPVMIAPSYVGVEVLAGRHVIAFKYKSYPDYPVLVAIGVLTMLALVAWPRREMLLARYRSVRFRNRGAPAGDA